MTAKERTVEHEDVYDAKGNVKIRILNKVKLTQHEKRLLVTMAKARYKAFIDMEMQRLKDSIPDWEAFFDTHCSTGFFSGKQTIHWNGSEITKSEFLEQEKDELLKSLKHVKIKCIDTFKPPIYEKRKK